MYLHGLIQLGYLKKEATSYAIGNAFFRTWLQRLSEHEWLTESSISAESTLRLYNNRRTEPPDTTPTNSESDDVAEQKYGTYSNLIIPSAWHVDEDRFEIAPDLYRKLHHDFSYLSTPERQIIQAVLRGTPLPDVDPMHLHGLIQLGYLKKEANSYIIGNAFFKNWLQGLSEHEWLTESVDSAEAPLRLQYEQRTKPPDSVETDPVSDDVAGQKYGTYRDLTIDDVRAIVARCLAFKKQGGRVTEFYRRENTNAYTLETLRSWLKDKRFRPPDDSEHSSH